MNDEGAWEGAALFSYPIIGLHSGCSQLLGPFHYSQPLGIPVVSHGFQVDYDSVERFISFLQISLEQRCD